MTKRPSDEENRDEPRQRNPTLARWQMLDVGTPIDVAIRSDLPSWLLSSDFNGRLMNSLLSSEIMSTNDNCVLSQKEREARLIELFARAGVELEFTGGEEGARNG